MDEDQNKHAIELEDRYRIVLDSLTTIKETVEELDDVLDAFTQLEDCVNNDDF